MTGGGIARVGVVGVEMPRNIKAWRPFQPLTQAEYNALVASGGWDPDTMYAITPQRVVLGGREVWPGPWPGGIVSVTDGIGASVNPTQVIPTTQPGNLLVAIAKRGGTANLPLVSAISDDAGQSWTSAAATTSTWANASCWYMPDSASISEVRFTASAAPLGWRIYEISEMATSDVLDTADAWWTGANVSGATLAVTVAQRSVVFAAISVNPQATGVPPVYPTTRPGAPWTRFDVLTLPPGAGYTATADAAMTVLEGGTTATAQWANVSQTFQAAVLYAAFRTVAAEPYVPPPF